MNVKPLRICFVGNMLGRNPGYITTQGQILADLFAADGYSVISASSKINRVRRLSDIVQIIINHRKQIDLVIAEVYSGQSFVIADVVSFLCRFLKIHLVLVLHGGNLPEFSRRYPCWTKRVLARSHLLIAPSTFLAREMECAGFRIRVVPNVVDLKNYPFKIRGRITPNLIWMRSFHSIYNPQMALRVLAALRADFPEAKLTMGGRDKGLEAEIKKMAKDMNLEKCVRFPGFLDAESKLEEFDRADVYLNTNKIDNMPVSVIEACALGVPVVATDVGGVSHIIQHGENGLLVPDDDAERMAATVKMLLENPELTKKVSENGRRLAEKSDWQAVKGEWEELFAEVLNKHRGVSSKPVESIARKYAE